MAELGLASVPVLWVVVLVQGIMLVLLYRQMGLFYLGTAEGVSRDGLKVGTAIPPIDVKDMQGREISFRSTGMWRLVVFGRSQCAACKELAPQLIKAQESYGPDLEVVFLTTATFDETKRFVEETRLNLPVYLAERQDISNVMHVRVSPFAFVLDPDGIIRSKGLCNGLEHIAISLRNAGYIESHKVANA